MRQPCIVLRHVKYARSKSIGQVFVKGTGNPILALERAKIVKNPHFCTVRGSTGDLRWTLRAQLGVRRVSVTAGSEQRIYLQRVWLFACQVGLALLTARRL